LGILWLAHHNLEIDWKIGEVKIMRYSKEYGKQWRLKQGKVAKTTGRRKEKSKRGELEEKKKKKKKKKVKGSKTMNVKKK